MSSKEYKMSDVEREVAILKVDLANFFNAMIQSGIVEIVKDEEGQMVYKTNKVVLVDESVQQD
jgi:hypothetical protein